MQSDPTEVKRRGSLSRLFCIQHSALCILFGTLLAAGANAQVDPSGRWRTLHTQHFRVHFRPDDRLEAGRAAREAERAYGRLSLELHRPRGVIDLTVSDDFDEANGFTTPWPSNRFTVLLTTPASDAELQ